MTRTISIFSAAVLSLSLFGTGIDNAPLLPKWVGDSEVKLERLSQDATASPDWVKSLIIVEANVATASTDGTLAGMSRVLDHLAETGVNGLWLTPVNEHPHYGNFGIHTLNSALTGTGDIPEQWRRVRAFVQEAHRRNIRVFFDVVSWGVTKDAPLYREKPEWFKGALPAYNGWEWNWKNPELREWFASRLVEFLLVTGADGFRCDSSPGYAGYGPFREARKRLLDFGRKVILFSEHPSERRGVFDFDQLSIMYDGGNTGTRLPCRIFMQENIVGLIKSGRRLGNVDSQFNGGKVNLDGGRERFYSFPLSNHDNRQPQPPFSAVEFGYQALFSPLIPIWYLGAEWRNPVDGKGWSWDLPVRWDLLDDEREFFELVKRMIRIRRSYPEIFEYFPASLRDANICKVETDRPEELQAYARYRNGKAILIVPNNRKEPATFRISIPYREARIAGDGIAVTDLLNDRRLASGRPDSFSVEIPAETPGVYLIAPER